MKKIKIFSKKLITHCLLLLKIFNFFIKIKIKSVKMSQQPKFDIRTMKIL